MGLPVICSDAYGVKDAMVDDVTGLRCKVGDIDSLYSAMVKLADDKNLQNYLGNNGRDRVTREFNGADVTKNWVQFYADIFK